MKVSIVTRHMAIGREKSLERLLLSMAKFDASMYEHVFLMDWECKGVALANGLFEKNKNSIHGDYIYMMDDDDWFTLPKFPQDLLQFIEQQHYPDIIMMRFVIAGKDLPVPWGNFSELICGTVGTPNFCLKRDVWLKHIKHFSGPRGGDFRLVKSLQAENYSVSWWNQRIGTTRQRAGRGRVD